MGRTERRGRGEREGGGAEEERGGLGLTGGSRGGIKREGEKGAGGAVVRWLHVRAPPLSLGHLREPGQTLQ